MLRIGRSNDTSPQDGLAYANAAFPYANVFRANWLRRKQPNSAPAALANANVLILRGRETFARFAKIDAASEVDRLVRAETADNKWGQAFAYDGFGYLTNKTVIKGSPAPPSFTATFDPATNRQTGIGLQYDANGNPTNGISDAYDVENRYVGGVSNPEQWYGYDPSGRRIWMIKPRPMHPYAGPTTCEIYFYGITGQKLVTYACGWHDGEGGDGEFWIGTASENTYFGGKLIKSKGVTVVTDRLGSVRANANGDHFSYYPYGEEQIATPDGREKFGTYTRDSSGVDYADQRYYAVGTGRFLTPDPSGVAVSDASDPTTWDRYGYVRGDPTNLIDPTGLDAEHPNSPGLIPCWIPGVFDVFWTRNGYCGPTYGNLTTDSITLENSDVTGELHPSLESGEEAEADFDGGAAHHAKSMRTGAKAKVTPRACTAAGQISDVGALTAGAGIALSAGGVLVSATGVGVGVGGGMVTSGAILAGFGGLLAAIGAGMHLFLNCN